MPYGFHTLEELQTELGELAVNDAMTYQPLYEMIQVCCKQYFSVLKLNLSETDVCIDCWSL